jgi:hypothetical protein
MQKIEECPAAAPAVAVLELEALQEHEGSQDFGIAEGRLGGLGVEFLEELDFVLEQRLDFRGVGIFGTGFVNEAGVEGAVRLNQRLKGFAGVEVDGVLLFHGLFQGDGELDYEFLVIANEILGDADVFIGERGGIDGDGRFVTAGGLEMLAIERAIDGDFAFGSAADGADFAADAGTMAPGASLLTDLTKDVHRRLSLSYHRSMRRTQVYIKVEVELDDKEKPERVANEICRVVRKVYGVRVVEVSSIVERDAG